MSCNKILILQLNKEPVLLKSIYKFSHLIIINIIYPDINKIIIKILTIVLNNIKFISIDKIKNYFVFLF